MSLSFSSWVFSVSLEVSVRLKFPQMSSYPHNFFLTAKVLLKFAKNRDFNVVFNNDIFAMWKML